MELYLEIYEELGDYLSVCIIIIISIKAGFYDQFIFNNEIDYINHVPFS